MHLLHQLRLREEHEIVVFRKVLEKKSEFAKAFHVHEMGIVDDRDEHFPFMINLPAGLDEELFALGVAAIGFYFEGGAEYVEGVGVGVQRPGYGRGDHAFRIMVDNGLLDDALAGAGFPHNNAKPALLGMNLDCLEDFLLLRQERRFLLIEGILFYSEV